MRTSSGRRGSRTSTPTGRRTRPATARACGDHDPLVARFDGDVTLDRLVALLDYFNANGAIKGNNTYDQLRRHLDQAAQNDEAFEAQIRAFANQTAGKAPKFVDQAAADALVGEANRLIGGWAALTQVAKSCRYQAIRQVKGEECGESPLRR